MNCSKYRNFMDDYMRGLLDQSLCAQIEDHLTVCSSCNVEYESHKSLLEFLEKEPASTIEKDELADFLPGVWEKIGKQSPRNFKNLIWKFAPTLVTAVILAFLILKPPVNVIPESGNNQYAESQYSESSYYSLISELLDDDDLEAFDAIESELYSENYLYDISYYWSDIEGLSDDEYNLLEEKLDELTNTAG